MAITPKKKLVLIGFMLFISSIGLFLVISMDEVKKHDKMTIDGNLVLGNGTVLVPVVTYDPMTGSPHVSMVPQP